MKIAFHDNSLSLRGTTVAIYDWAYWSKIYLDQEPIILFDKTHSANSNEVFDKFKKEFSVFGYGNKNNINTILSQNNCTHFLMEKGGKPDGVISSVCKNLINAISVCDKNDIHGDVFAFGSKWLSSLHNYTIPFVPYIVHLPNEDSNMRDELNIPKHAIVFGRNGGFETFDLQFVKDTIKHILDARNDIWFIFQYTEQFINHERVIYLKPTADLKVKTQFINTCDAMIHARYVGESFGLSCGEFSLRNKPIITWNGSPERSHIDILGDKALLYNDEKDLFNILSNISKTDINSGDWNCYQEYSPENVMNKFKEVYL